MTTAGTLESTRQRSSTERAARRRLRAGVLRLGSFLGWDARQAVRFTEAVAGRPWRHCGRTELVQVLGAFAELAAHMRASSGACPADDSARTALSHDRQSIASGRRTWRK